MRTVIDSLGVALPTGVLVTQEVLDGCARPLKIPLEQITGIASRPAAEGEHAFDLALRAARDCLARTTVPASSVDLLISASISRYDEPGRYVTYEPSAAARLAHALGCSDTWAFDVTNACAGTFTAVRLADTLIATGRVRSALVVSGEYITHLLRTAQLEIEHELDERLPCLTLGDAGVAALLVGGDDGAGFEHIGLRTVGRHHRLCVAGPTTGPHGGAIMKTDMFTLAEVGIHEAVDHCHRTLAAAHVRFADLDLVIPHQTTANAIASMIRYTNKRQGEKVLHPGMVVNNLAHRGNTSTTTHLLALWDASRSGRVESGHRLVFGIVGSGITVGTALYQTDDLPDRIRTGRVSTRAVPVGRPGSALPQPVQVASVGLAPPAECPPRVLDLVGAAVADCLHGTGLAPAAVDVLMHTGVYRDGMIAEPALAAIIAGELGLDGSATDTGDMLAFDLTNGAHGTLDACRAGAELVAAGAVGTVLITAAEVEQRRDGDEGLSATGSALLLRPSTDGSGFLGFHSRRDDRHLDDFRSWTVQEDGRTYVASTDPAARGAGLGDRVAEAAGDLIKEFGLTPGDVRAVVPVGPEPCFTSALALTLARLRAAATGPDGGPPLAPGDLVVLTGTGSGGIAGAALYRW